MAKYLLNCSLYVGLGKLLPPGTQIELTEAEASALPIAPLLVQADKPATIRKSQKANEEA